MEQLAKNLLTLRKRRKLIRNTVATALGISAKSYERYEKNERDPTAPLMVKLADFYDVSLDQLVGREPLPDSTDEEE